MCIDLLALLTAAAEATALRDHRNTLDDARPLIRELTSVTYDATTFLRLFSSPAILPRMARAREDVDTFRSHFGAKVLQLASALAAQCHDEHLAATLQALESDRREGRLFVQAAGDQDLVQLERRVANAGGRAFVERKSATFLLALSFRVASLPLDTH